MMKNAGLRVEWIDIAKGIGIVLVVLGHIQYLYADRIYMVIKEFHMPLFFFLSGYWIKNEKSIKMGNEILKKIKSLYLPFVIFNLLFVFLHNTFCELGIYGNMTEYAKMDYLLEVVRVLRFGNRETVSMSMWFIRVLFFAYLGYVFLLWGIKKTERLSRKAELLIQWIIVAGLAVLGYYTNFPMGLSVSCIAVAFLHLGRMYRIYENAIKLRLWMSIVAIIALIPLSFFNNVRMGTNQYSNIILLYLGSVLGIYFIIYVSKKLESSKISVLFKYLGRNSLWIMSFHMMFLLFVNCIQVQIMKLPGELKSAFPTILNTNLLWVILYLVIGLFAPALLHMLWEKIKEVCSNGLLQKSKK